MIGDTSLYFASFNRNKKGLMLNLKTEQGRKILHKLIKESDVLVTNYGPNVPSKLGFDFSTISEINPRMIMTHITGFGRTGPYKNKSAFDGIIQAMSGIVHLTGEASRPPTKVGIYIADHIAGLQGVIGTLLALYKREQNNKGQLVDISMLDSMTSLLSYNLSDVSVLGNSPHRAGNDSTNVFATTFKTVDGYMYIAPLTDRMWASFCNVIGKSSWGEKNSPYYDVNHRLANYEFLKEEIEKWTINKTNEEVQSMLEDRGIACAKVSSIEEVLDNPQIKTRQMLQKLDIENKFNKEVIVPGNPIKLSGSHDNIINNPPLKGEHTREILKQLNYTNMEIEALVEKNVIYANLKD